MTKLKQVKVFSLAKLHAVVMACVGLILGIIYSFGGAIIDILVSMGWITSASTSGIGGGTLLAFLALIGMPLIFGTLGFIIGGVVAFLYNIISRLFGGIEIDFK